MLGWAAKVLRANLAAADLGNSSLLVSGPGNVGSSQPYVVMFATCHKEGKWKYYSDYKAVITVPCSCFGRNEQKCHLDFDGGKDKLGIGPADVAFPCLAAHSKDM